MGTTGPNVQHSILDQAYAAIQWAIETSGHENKRLYIPNGTYDISGDLEPKSGIIIFGDGPNNTILNFTSTGSWETRRIWIHDVNNVSIKNLQCKYGQIMVEAVNENIHDFTFINVKMVETNEILNGSFRIHACGNTSENRKTIEYVNFDRCQSIDARCTGFNFTGDYNASDSPTKAGIIRFVNLNRCKTENKRLALRL